MPIPIQKHKDEISAGPKQDSMLQPTTTQPSKFKALQNTKIIKLGLLSLTPLFFNRRFNTSNLKNTFIFLPPEKRFPTSELEVGFANHYANNLLSSRYNMKYQISNSRSKNLLTLDFSEPMQHNVAPFSPILGFPYHRCTCTFNRPWCPSLNRIRASAELFIHKFLVLMVSPIFRIWSSQLHLGREETTGCQSVYTFLRTTITK